MSGFEEELTGAIAVREEQRLRGAPSEERLEIHQRLDEGIGLKGYLHCSLDVGRDSEK